MIENDKFRNLFEKFIKVVTGFRIMNKGKELLFLKDKELICFSRTLKSRLEIVFPIQGDLVSFNPKYEKVKGSEILIELRDDLEIWKIIEGRLNIS